MIILPISLKNEIKKLLKRGTELPTHIRTSKLIQSNFDIYIPNFDREETFFVDYKINNIKFIKDIEYNYYSNLSGSSLLERFLEAQDQLKELEELRCFKSKIIAAKDVLKELGE